MKYWSVGYHIVTKNFLISAGGITLMTIGYKYIHQKVLEFITMEGGVSTEPVVSHSSSYPENYSNVFYVPRCYSPMIYRYFSVCNAISNHNSMQ